MDVLSEISKKVELEKFGDLHRGKCPVCESYTKMLLVNHHSDVWHCFGCAKGGDVSEWIAHYTKNGVKNAQDRAD